MYRTKHHAQVMVLGVLGLDRKLMPAYFFKPGEKIGAEAYTKVLRYTVLPWLKANYPANDYYWMQDGTSPHTLAKAWKF